MTLKIALIGGGRMGQAMLKGWVANNLDITISLFDPFIAPEILPIFEEKSWPINPSEKQEYDIIILAVKPQNFDEISKSILPLIVSNNSILLSIMAGINIDKLGNNSIVSKICRAMPNTPGQIGKGVTAYYSNANINFEDEKIIENLLAPLGLVAKLKSEDEIDAVTALSGSGPAYVFLLAEAMAEAGNALGLDEEMANLLARQTIIGAAELMNQSIQSPEELRKAVTSKGGTTFAALQILMGQNGMNDLLLNSMKAAFDRSRELGK